MTDIYSEFKSSALRYGDNVFVYQPGGSSYFRCHYRQALKEVDALASFLADLSLAKGTKVGLISENRYEWFVVYLASVSLGFTVVPLDPKLPLNNWCKLLEHAETRLLFISDRLAEHSAALSNGVPTLQQVIQFEDFGIPPLCKGRLGGELQRPEVGDDDIASLIYTSGTTGNPKGVMLSHSNLITSGAAINGGYGNHGEIIASILPLHHAYGFGILTQSYLFGMSIVLYPTINPEIIFRSFSDLKPHYVAGIPAFFERIGKAIQERITSQFSPRAFSIISLLSRSRLGNTGSHFRFLKKVAFKKIQQGLGGRLRCLPCGGSAMDSRWTRLFNLLGIEIAEGYGLTETSPFICANDTRFYRIGSVGRPARDIKIKIMQADKDGTGEICVKGPTVMKGYYKNPEATREVIDQDGWFHTGDLGYLDKDGFLFISGRKKDVIVTASGKNIYPDELEHYLGDNTLIKEICVFGISRQRPTRSKDELVHVQIVPDWNEAKQRGLKDVEDFIRKEIRSNAQALPDYKRPRSIGFSKDPFPRSSTLKIKKYLVKQQWLEQQAERIPEIAKTAKEITPPRQVEAIGPWLIAKISEQLGVIPDDMAVDESLTSYGLDSLSAVELAQTIETELGIPLLIETLFESPSIGHIVEELQNQFVMSPEKRGIKSSEPDLQAEVVLDPEILFEHKTFEPISPPKNIFLTGATGFLGAFLLDKLLRKTEAKIHCLVRASDHLDGKNRISRNLEFFSLWDDVHSRRIIPVTGNLSKPRLGLSEEEFENLARDIDVIYHNGALVNFIFPYRDLKLSNVFGTQEVIRLAAHVRLKPLHYISTLSVFPTAGHPDSKIFYEDDDLSCDKGLLNGYAQSKWIAENILMEAHSRGLPTCIYRVGEVIGHSQTGACRASQDAYSVLMKGCVELQSAPNLNLNLYFVPVDYVASATYQLSTQQDSLGQAFHLTNPVAIHVSKLFDLINALGYPLRRVTLEEWALEILKSSEQAPKTALASFIPFLKGQTVTSLGNTKSLLWIDCKKTLDSLKETSISCPPPDKNLFLPYFSYLTRSGFITTKPH